MEDRIKELKKLIAEKEIVITPLRSELARLQWELRTLELGKLGVRKGTRIISDDGVTEWVVTKARNSKSGTGLDPQIHMDGRMVLTNGELSKKITYIGILGFHNRIKKTVAA